MPKSISDLDLAGQRVLVRVDFNVPLDDNGKITDDSRIRAALPTIRAILEARGKPVLLSHLGRPKGEVRDSLRLDPVGQRLPDLLGTPVQKLSASIGDDVARAIDEAPDGTTILLENVRFHPGETKGDPELSRAFAALGDVFVNDAFGASHRAHCSVSGIAEHLPSAAGLLLEKEIQAFARVLEDPARPFVAILGGAKVSDKLLVIENLLSKVDALLIGGAMAYTFLAARGVPVGTSLVEKDRLDLVRGLMEDAEKRGVDILLPIDHLTAAEFTAEAKADVTEGEAIEGERMGLDIGPKTCVLFADRIAEARTIVWNGPMGVFEMRRFRSGTEAVARAVAEAEGFSVVGGGDSVAAIHLIGLSDRIDHISTGGGASLELLGGAVLPGIACLD